MVSRMGNNRAPTAPTLAEQTPFRWVRMGMDNGTGRQREETGELSACCAFITTYLFL
jgi:hypothetical protein